MTHTTEKMKATANEIADKIGGYVDDFGKFGNFSLLVHFDSKDPRTNLKPITAKIRNVIKNYKEAELRDMEIPKRSYTTYTYCGYTDRLFNGYWRNYIQIDLDFIKYNPQSNDFAVQK